MPICFENIEEFENKFIENINETMRLLYNNFTKYFKSGDLIITGSITYMKLGLIEKKIPKDIDICINSGNIGDDILNEIINFYSGRTGCTVIKRNWTDFRAVICTPYSTIDVFRYNFDKSKMTEVEIISGVTTKYYGNERIINVLIEKYVWFNHNEIKSKHNEKQIIKFKKMIGEIYNKTKHEITNQVLIDKIRKIVNDE